MKYCFIHGPDNNTVPFYNMFVRFSLFWMLDFCRTSGMDVANVGASSLHRGPPARDSAWWMVQKAEGRTEQALMDAMGLIC